MTLRALWAEGPMLLAALLVQALPGAAGQVATLGALMLLAFRLYWRALRGEAPPVWPGAALWGFMIRVALALGVWVMLGSLGFVGLGGALDLAGVAHELRGPLALAGALLVATPLTLALAVTGLPPPLLPPDALPPDALRPDALPPDAARPGLLDALKLPATLGWLLLLVLGVCAMALMAWLVLPAPLAAGVLTGSVALTTLTLAHLWRGVAPPTPGAAVFG